MTDAFTNRTGIQTSLGQIMQSIFDTVALALILIKARKGSGSGLIALITKQGLAYYMCVCSQPLKGLTNLDYDVKIERGNVP